MKKMLVVITSLAVIGAIVVVVYARDHSPEHPRRELSMEHATGIDRGDASRSMMAMLNAHEGATPCETTYLALEAEQADARVRGGVSMFQWIAPRAEFLARCATLPPEAQRCTMPRYRRDHAEVCLRVKPPADVLAQMVVAAPIAEQPAIDHPPELEAARPQR